MVLRWYGVLLCHLEHTIPADTSIEDINPIILRTLFCNFSLNLMLPLGNNVYQRVNCGCFSFVISLKLTVNPRMLRTS